MHKVFGLLLFVLWASGARADACPDFYRFVDFGLRDLDGNTHRGGAVFRAEGFDERALLLLERTVCREVREVSKDGRGNPIPVVTRIEYDPAETGLDLEALSVSAVDDPAAMAAENAQAHVARLDRPGMDIARGDQFLCVRETETLSTSCQFVSPYKGNVALVAYCDAGRCTLPVLAINDRLVISASWSAEARGIDAVGTQMFEQIKAIHAFLAPLSSGV